MKKNKSIENKMLNELNDFMKKYGIEGIDFDVHTLNRFNPKCEDKFDICSENSDANCYREREMYSEKAVKNNPNICDGCVYNNTK